MKTLAVVSRLLCYPCGDLQRAVPEMRQVIREEGLLTREVQWRLDAFLGEIESTPLLDLQEVYVNLFDRGRNLSLHLFEHVHGESRDRGQAMVELMNQYAAAGLEVDAYELPDYLPLFLEYLSQCERAEVEELLGDAMGVVILLGARLTERGSSYAVAFDALECIVGTPEDAAEFRKHAAGEGPDETIEKMDEIWEEEQVTFLGNNDPASDGCTAGAGQGDQVQVSAVEWIPGREQSGQPGRGAARDE